MGFVDLVGTATNYVKAEFDLANGTANLFTTMVFFWFLIFAVPTGMLMNKISRRKTVLWSILVTLVAMGTAHHRLRGTIRHRTPGADRHLLRLPRYRQHLDAGIAEPTAHRVRQGRQARLHADAGSCL